LTVTQARFGVAGCIPTSHNSSVGWLRSDPESRSHKGIDMNRWSRNGLLPALVLGLFGGANALAQQPRKPADPARQATKWAVVVGINQYLDRDIPKLKYSVPDAWLVGQQLTAKCGYDPNHVLVITDDQEKPHLRPLRINLEEQVPAWLERAEPGDTVLVFFAGHGFLDDRGQAYLAPQDCRLNRLGLTGIRTEELRNMLQNCKATQKVLVLDCCHSGSAKGDAPAGPSGQELGAAFRQAEGLVTLASCRKSEQSYEWNEREHGLFTFYVAEGLGGAADYDLDGIINSDELYRYLSEHVPTTARTELNARQTPIRLIGEDVTGVFPLARLGGPSRKLTRWYAPVAALPGPLPGMPKPVPNGIPHLSER
ncbi:MAG: caspase family protein, partial [Mycobacterium sp.]|nr:caspase family protein [Mycobacterium sp.]